MNGYESTDGELDTDNEDEQEHELSRWLKQLDEPIGYNTQTTRKCNSKPSTPHRTPTRSVNSANGLSKVNGFDGLSTLPSTNGSPSQGEGEIVDFDSILGDLNALDRLFEPSSLNLPPTSTAAQKPNAGPPPSVRPKSTVRTSVVGKEEDLSNDFESCDAVLRGALFELNTIVNTGSSDLPAPPVFGGGLISCTSETVHNSAVRVNAEVKVVHQERPETRHMNRRPSATSTSTSESSELSIKEECSSPETGNYSLSSKATNKASQMCIQVHMPGGQSSKVIIDDTTTARRLCDILMKSKNVPLITKWMIVEHLPDLFIERRVESHELVIDVVGKWNKESSTNKLMFVEVSGRYSAYANDDDQEGANSSAKLEGSLYLKSEGKKMWKKLDFSLQSNGIYCRTGKGKPEMTCLQTMSDVCIYISHGWRKKYKSPTEYGISLKPPFVQSKSPKLIKYICAEDEATFKRWLDALRKLKYGSLLHSTANKPSKSPELRQQFSASASSLVCYQPVDQTPPTPVIGDELLGLGPNSTGTVHRRKGSLVPALPISTQTTRLLSQQRSTVCATKDLADDGSPALFRPSDSTLPPFNVSRNQDTTNSPAPPTVSALDAILTNPNAASDFPSPPVMKTTTPLPINGSGHSSPSHQLMTSEKKKIAPPPPTKKMTNGTFSAASGQAFVSCDEQKSTEPQRTPSIGKSSVPINNLSPQHVSPARAKPPPPKRSETTRLTSGTSINNPVQTKTFIMNLDRVIEQKKSKGCTGLSNIPVPLPPRPVYVEGPTYLDTDDLPPPPAELLEGLRQMRVQTGVLIASPYMRRV